MQLLNLVRSGILFGQLTALKAVAVSAFMIIKENTEKIYAETRKAIADMNRELKEVSGEYEALR